jgi:hypothetical protein
MGEGEATAKPPEKPSEELIYRLEKDKRLDPATGLPLPDAPEKTSEIEPAPARLRNRFTACHSVRSR